MSAYIENSRLKAHLTFFTLISSVISAVFAFNSEPIWAADGLKVTLQESAKTQDIQTFSENDLKRLKQKSGSEKRPQGNSASYNGALLQPLVDEALSKVPLNVRAQVDLIVLKGEKREALIPRSFINKFQMVMSATKTGFESVVPGWMSNSKMKAEEVPVESYFLESVREVTLTSYRTRYNEYFLVKRTDPAAMRGEKIFTQAGLSCHATGIGPDPSKWKSTELSGMKKTAHPPKMPRFELNEKMIRALVSYWENKDRESSTKATLK